MVDQGLFIWSIFSTWQADNHRHMFRLSDSKMNLEFPSGQPLVSSPGTCFNNSRKQFLFLTSDALFNRKRNLTVPGRCHASHILLQCLFPHWLIKSYLTFWNGDVINDVMIAWHIAFTTIHLHIYTCKLLFVRHHSSYSNRRHKHRHILFTGDKYDEYGQTHSWSNLDPYPIVFWICLQ